MSPFQRVTPANRSLTQFTETFDPSIRPSKGAGQEDYIYHVFCCIYPIFITIYQKFYAIYQPLSFRWSFVTS